MAITPDLHRLLKNLKTLEDKLTEISDDLQGRLDKTQYARDGDIPVGLRDVLLDNPIRSKSAALACPRKLYHFLN